MEKMERVAETKDRLREALEMMKLKPIDLAQKTGLNSSTISRYLSGAMEPRQEATFKISGALGVSEMWLWGYDVPMQRTEAQKKNDSLVRLVAQLKNDPEFFSICCQLAELDAANYASIKQLISALGGQK